MPDTAYTPPRSAPPTPPPAQPRWVLPEPGSSFADIRLFRKQRLAAALRLFALYGFDHGPAGHITVRDPEWQDHFWINPFGQYFGQVRVSDLLLVNHDGLVVAGNRTVNLAGFHIHSAIHRARPEVIGVAHSHAPYGKSFSTLHKFLAPLTQDAAAFYEGQALSGFTGIVWDGGQAQKIVQDAAQSDFVILENHGFLTAGPSVEAAAWNFIAMEDAARTQLQAEAAGTPLPLPHEVAAFTAAQYRTHPDAGRYYFQPLYERILREQPDFLD